MNQRVLHSIWVGDGAMPTDPAPLRILSVDCARELLQVALSPEFRRLRAQGCRVICDRSCDRETRSLVKALRAALRVDGAGRLAEIARDLELPTMAAGIEALMAERPGRSYATIEPEEFRQLILARPEGEEFNPELERARHLLLAVSEL